MDDREQQVETLHAIKELGSLFMDHVAAVFDKVAGELPDDEQDSYMGCQ